MIDTLNSAYIEMGIIFNRHLFSINRMNLFSLLDDQTVITNLEGKTKEQVINALVDTLSSKFDDDVLKEIRDGVFERESVMSTGVGKGLAIPHCKTKAVSENYAAFAKLNKPLDYDSIDEEPVQIIFLLVGPDSKNSHHIKLLSRISRLMNNASFREKILASKNKETILEAFKEEEEKYFVN